MLLDRNVKTWYYKHRYLQSCSVNHITTKKVTGIMNSNQSDILQDFFLRSALRLTQLEEASLRKICGEDLSLKELHVIEAVSSLTREGGNTMTRLSRYLHISPASVTTSVSALVRKGYMERSFSDSDRRNIHARLTPKGEEACRLYVEFIKDMVESCCGSLDDSDCEAFINVSAGFRQYLTEKSEGAVISGREQV